MGRRFLFLVGIIFSTTTFFAQKSLFGKIVDEKTEAPLGDVLIEYIANSKKKTIRTSNDGVFEINLSGVPKSSKIKIKALGKENKTLLLSEAIMNEFITIPLKDRGQTSVTASRWEQSVNEIPASIIVIEREEIQELGYVNVQELIENIPGMYIIDQRSFNDISIGIRGFCGPFNRHVMIQINGVSMMSEFQNDFKLDKMNISIESIDKIEVIRGPMSIIYGTGAFFGVINIITNELKQPSNSMVSSAFGSQNSNRQFFRYGLNRNGLKLSLNASSVQRDGFKENFVDLFGEDRFEQYYNNEIISDSIINSNHYARINQGVNFSMDYEGFFMNLNYAQSNVGIGIPYQEFRLPYRTNSLYSEIGYRNAILDDRLSYEIKIGYINSAEEIKLAIDSSLIVKELIDLSCLRSQINTRTVLMNNNIFHADLIIGASHNYTLDNVLNYNRITNNSFTEIDISESVISGLSPDSRLNTFAGYAQLELKYDLSITGRDIGSVQLISGGRLERQNSYKMKFERHLTNPIVSEHNYVSDINSDNNSVNFIPRLALIFSLKQNGKPEHYFRAMYNQAIKQSSIADNVFVMRNNDFNPDLNSTYLRPEKIKTLEFGYTFKNEKLGIETNINYFNNELSDLIVQKTYLIDDGVQKYDFTRTENIGDLITTGVELIARKWWEKKINENKKIDINLSSNFSYQKTTNNEYSDSIPFSPNITGGFKLRLGIGHLKINKLNLGKITIGSSMNYVGSMNSETIIDEDVETSIANPSKGFAFYSLNLRVSDLNIFKRGNSINNQKGFYFNTKISNLLDTKFFYPSTSYSDWAVNGVLGRGRSFLFTLGYKF